MGNGHFKQFIKFYDDLALTYPVFEKVRAEWNKKSDNVDNKETEQKINFFEKS